MLPLRVDPAREPLREWVRLLRPDVLRAAARNNAKRLKGTTSKEAQMACNALTKLPLPKGLSGVANKDEAGRAWSGHRAERVVLHVRVQRRSRYHSAAGAEIGPPALGAAQYPSTTRYAQSPALHGTMGR